MTVLMVGMVKRNMQSLRQHLRCTAAHGEYRHVAALDITRRKGCGNCHDLKIGQTCIKLPDQLRQILCMLENALALAKTSAALLNDK